MKKKQSTTKKRVIKKKASKTTARPSRTAVASKAKPAKTKKALAKPKIAFYWCSSCGGCEETIVDLDEKILDVVAAVDIVFWPCAMDFKRADVEAMPDKSIAVSFINGAVRTDEQEAMAKMLRQKSQVVIAFGMCAFQGGIPALANLTNKQGILSRAYLQAESVSNPEGVVPQERSEQDGCDLEIPRFYETVHKLSDVIEVDYAIPGCPPTVGLLVEALGHILNGTLPEKGAVLAPAHSLCKSCVRNETKPETITIGALKRVQEIEANTEDCFLAQGVLCMGPATRDGCQELCIKGNMPCTGCFGSLPDTDPGAKMIGAVGGLADGETEETIANWVDSVVDPAGTFYRYSLSASLLGRERKEKKDE
jgi:F420-non-reducing hydrogenase small subunit